MDLTLDISLGTLLQYFRGTSDFDEMLNCHTFQSRTYHAEANVPDKSNSLYRRDITAVPSPFTQILNYMYIDLSPVDAHDIPSQAPITWTNEKLPQAVLTFAGGSFSSRQIPLGTRKRRSISAPGCFHPRGCRAFSICHGEC